MGVRWCENCQQETRRVEPPVCEICGQIIQTNSVCKRCHTLAPRYKAVRSWAQFEGPIRAAIHDLKYQRNIGLGESLAQHLVSLFQQYNWAIDLVAPVPLGKERYRQRGYNQAALLAQPFAHKVKLPYDPRILRRIKETQSQVYLSFTQRQLNVKDAFLAIQHGIQGKQILIIDDVMTSGSTINACADALMKVGTKAVFGLTVARPGLYE